MPLVNIYVSKSSDAAKVGEFAPLLMEEIVRELSIGDRKLSPDEVSVRIVEYKPGSKPITPVEVEITMRAYQERIEKSDQICMAIQKFILSKMGKISRVWLVFCEIAHS